MGVKDLDAFLTDAPAPAKSGTAALDAFLTEPDTRNAITRAYQSVIKPITSAVTTVAEPFVRSATRLPVAAARVAQGEPISQVIRYPEEGGDATGAARPLVEAVIPQTPLEAGAQIGAMGAGGLAMRAGLTPGLAALSRITGGVVGGAAGEAATEGGSGGRGALVGGAGAAGGELLGKGTEILSRSAWWAKPAISRGDAKRFGQTLEDVAGVPGARSATDFTDAATGAAQRRTAGEATFADAQAAHKGAVEDARRVAAEQTRGARADWDAEWQRRKGEYQTAAQEAEQRAQQATRDARAERVAEWERRKRVHQQQVDAAKEQARVATERATATQRAQQAEDIRDVIVRNVPQLAPAFEGQTGAAAVRGAGAGRARKVLSGLKEETTVALEQGAPGGIVVPSLAPSPAAAAGYITPRRMPIREALEELSLLGSDRTTQFARNPLDRNIQGAARRHRQGQLRREIQQALEQEQRGLGDVFDRGQTTYKEGFAATTRLLEPDASFLPTGEVNMPGIAGRVQKPRMQSALTEKLGPERTAAMTGEITAIPREAPRIEPVLPPPPRRPLEVAPVYPDLPTPPQRPMAVASVHPDIPSAPTPPAQSPADIVMSTLFGPQQRILQGRDTLVNWPAVQKALQAPEIRAQIEAAVGAEGYQRILRSALRGATSGADVPTQGSGRFGGPAVDWLAGRTPGAGITAAAPIRFFLPNLGAHYQGAKPLSLHPLVQQLIDLAGQRGADRMVPR